MKVRALRMAALIGLLLQPACAAAAAEGSWVSYLYMNDLRDLAVARDGVWCASRGGALFFDFSTSEFRTWNRTAGGLASDSLVAVELLEDGMVAFGTERVGISAYEPGSGLWFNYTSKTWDIASDEILFIREDPPWRLIGCRGGVMALRDGQLRVPCQQYLDPCGLPGWDVSAGIFHEGCLWFGTLPGEGALGGVGRVDYDTGVWDTLNTGLPSLEVTGFAVWGDSLFCSTISGVVVWIGEGWEARSGGLPPETSILDLHAGQNRLLAAASGQEGGVFAWEPETAAWVRLGSMSLHACCVEEGADGIVWAGTSAEWSGQTALWPYQDGLWELAGDEWIQHRQEGPHPVQNYRALVIDDKARVWAASVSPGWRISFLDNSGHWSVFGYWNTPIRNAWVFELRVEGDRVWIGHCCCPRAENECKLNIWTLGDTVATIVEPAFNIWDSAADDRGNLWFASYHEKPETHPDVVRGLFHWERDTDEWRQYDVESTEGLLRSNALSAVSVEGGLLWVGYATKGISRCVLEPSGLPTIADWAWSHFTTQSQAHPLAGDRVSAITSRPGEVWIGTDNGISLLDGGRWRIIRQTPWGLPGNQVRDIALTDDGAAWIAIAGEGVVRLSRDSFGEFSVFERFGPPELVNIEAMVLAVGAEGRDIWVGTAAGLSHYVPGAQLPPEPPDGVSAYPNPFNPRCGQQLRFRELPGRGNHGVVVDVSGRIVHEFERIWQGDPFWDGRDPDGEFVSPGLYIVSVVTPQGWLTGQIAVLDLPCE